MGSKTTDEGVPSGGESGITTGCRGRKILMTLVGCVAVVLLWQLEVEVNFDQSLQHGIMRRTNSRTDFGADTNVSSPTDSVMQNVTHIEKTTPFTKQPAQPTTTPPMRPMTTISTVRPLVILIWTGKSNDASDWFPGGITNELMNSCYSKGILTADQACQFTKDRQRLDEADALLFRARGLEMVDLPPRRSPKQHYIVWEIEPPHKTWRFINLTQYNGFFNLTATYAWDSDIPQNEHRNWVINQEKYDSLDKVDFVAEKRSDVPVAWFVSRCPTQSKREDYVKEMQKYVNVDVYGQCGTMQCTYQGAHFKDDECVRKLLGGKNSYKFYLAFENSLCEDYATEKIWKVTDTNVIPVVMGAVDYKRMFPPKTFIDVRDFESPKDLADFLLYLNKNDTEFNEYARRKSAMKLFMVGLTGSQCSICKGLHSFIGKQSIVYSLDEFWGARRCMQPNTFLKHHDASDFGVNLRDIRTPGRPVINTTSKKTNTYNMNKH